MNQHNKNHSKSPQRINKFNTLSMSYFIHNYSANSQSLPALPASAVNHVNIRGNKKGVGDTFCRLSRQLGLRIAFLQR